MFSKECVCGGRGEGGGKVKGEKRVVRKWKMDSYSFYGGKKKRRDDYFISEPTIFNFSEMGGNMRENVLNR